MAQQQRQPRTRSNEANAYYWGVVVAAGWPAMAETFGRPCDALACHAFLKRWLLKGRSTSSLTPVEFFHYVERCRELLAQHFGVVVPDPDPFTGNPVAEAPTDAELATAGT